MRILLPLALLLSGLVAVPVGQALGPETVDCVTAMAAPLVDTAIACTVDCPADLEGLAQCAEPTGVGFCAADAAPEPAEEPFLRPRRPLTGLFEFDSQRPLVDCLLRALHMAYASLT